MVVGKVGHYYGNFSCLKFNKKGKEIIGKANVLMAELEAKIKDREQRIAEAAKEAGMETAVDVLMQIQDIGQAVSNQQGLTVGLAGKIRKEIEARLTEVTEMEKLKVIARNLDSEETFTLAFEEIEYFGF